MAQYGCSPCSPCASPDTSLEQYEMLESAFEDIERTQGTAYHDSSLSEFESYEREMAELDEFERMEIMCSTCGDQVGHQLPVTQLPQTAAGPQQPSTPSQPHGAYAYPPQRPQSPQQIPQTPPQRPQAPLQRPKAQQQRPQAQQQRPQAQQQRPQTLQQRPQGQAPRQRPQTSIPQYRSSCQAGPPSAPKSGPVSRPAMPRFPVASQPTAMPSRPPTTRQSPARPLTAGPPPAVRAPTPGVQPTSRTMPPARAPISAVPQASNRPTTQRTCGGGRGTGRGPSAPQMPPLYFPPAMQTQDQSQWPGMDPGFTKEIKDFEFDADFFAADRPESRSKVIVCGAHPVRLQRGFKPPFSETQHIQEHPQEARLAERAAPSQRRQPSRSAGAPTTQVEPTHSTGAIPKVRPPPKSAPQRAVAPPRSAPPPRMIPQTIMAPPPRAPSTYMQQKCRGPTSRLPEPVSRVRAPSAPPQSRPPTPPIQPSRSTGAIPKIRSPAQTKPNVNIAPTLADIQRMEMAGEVQTLGVEIASHPEQYGNVRALDLDIVGTDKPPTSYPNPTPLPASPRTPSSGLGNEMLRRQFEQQLSKTGGVIDALQTGIQDVSQAMQAQMTITPAQKKSEPKTCTCPSPATQSPMDTHWQNMTQQQQQHDSYNQGFDYSGLNQTSPGQQRWNQTVQNTQNVSFLDDTQLYLNTSPCLPCTGYH